MTQTDKEVLLKSLTTKVPHYTHGLTPPPADVRLHGKATDKMMMQDALSPPISPPKYIGLLWAAWGGWRIGNAYTLHITHYNATACNSAKAS